MSVMEWIIKKVRRNEMTQVQCACQISPSLTMNFFCKLVLIFFGGV